MFEKDSNPSEKIAASQIQYIFTNPGCGDNAETHTVREWLGEFGMSLEDEFFVQWQEGGMGIWGQLRVMEFGQFFREAEKTASERIMELSWTAAFVGLYLHYETDQEFLPQFEQNVREITALLQMAPIKEGGRANE